MTKTDLIKEWFGFASNDLYAAVHLFETMHNKPLEIICYHCQQAVEKAIKGFLIYHDVEPPYIHDLEKLRLMCEEHDASFAMLSEPCRKLTAYVLPVVIQVTWKLKKQMWHTHLKKRRRFMRYVPV